MKRRFISDARNGQICFQRLKEDVEIQFLVHEITRAYDRTISSTVVKVTGNARSKLTVEYRISSNIYRKLIELRVKQVVRRMMSIIKEHKLSISLTRHILSLFLEDPIVGREFSIQYNF